MSLLIDNHPVGRMDDGTFVSASSVEGAGVCLFGTDDNGLTWEYISLIVRVGLDLVGGSPTYAGLLLLPTGRLLCIMLFKKGPKFCICMNYSDDGYNWTEPKAIVQWGNSPWSRVPVEKNRCTGPGGQPRWTALLLPRRPQAFYRLGTRGQLEAALSAYDQCGHYWRPDRER